MGLASSLFAKPVSKALTKSVVKQADAVVPKIASEIAQTVADDVPLPTKSLVTRKARGVTSNPTVKEEPVVAPQEDIDTGINTDPLFKDEEPVGMSINNTGSKFNIESKDASDIFGAGSSRIKYTEPNSGGSIEVLHKPDGSASVLSLEVPEKFRGMKIGESLQSQVMQDFPVLQGQVSSKAAAKTAYRLGRRPPSQPDASLDDVYKIMDEYSSVNLVSPTMQKQVFMPSKVDRIEDFGVEPELIAESGTDAFKALGLSAEKKEVWRKENKASQRSKLLPEIEEAAQKLFEGKLKPEEFRKLSAEKQPIVPLDKVPDMPSFTDIAGALTEAQVNKGIVGLNMKIPQGERVSSRLDIPAYNDYNTWIVSLHEGSTKSGAPIGYAKTAVLKNVEFVSDPKVALDIARRKPLGSGGRMGKATIARIFGDYVPHNPDNAKAYAEKIFNDPEWTQVGMNPYRASYFYDKTDNMPVVSADEIVQIGPLVMAKNVKKTKPDDPLFKVNKKDDASPTFAKGGIVKNEMNKLFAEGGVMQEGGTVDPVSGNEVPPGAMQEEVRDDIDAKLSEGEFVFPADVVRYWGLEKLMMMRDKAKVGLKKMAEIGQMGNAEEVPDAEALHSGEEEMDDETFSSEIDSIMGEEGGEEEREYAKGGDVRKYAPGGYVGGEENAQLYQDAPIKGFEMVPMTNDAGQTIYIPFINGVAQLSIPTGYKVKKAGDTGTTPTTTTTPTTSGGGTGGDIGIGGEGGTTSGGGGGNTTSGPGFTIGEDGKATANETSSTLGSIVGGILGFAALGPAGINLGSKAGAKAVSLSNFADQQAAMSFNVATKDTTDPANLTDVTSQAATMGKSGTGGAAADAGAAAASAAANAGHGPAAQGAAAQAAADAIVGGASPSAAAQAGSDAAASASGGTTGPGSATGFGVGSSIGINSMDAQSDAASAAAAGYAAADAVGAEGLGVGNIGADAGTGAADANGGAGFGEGQYAKGGLVSKPKKSNSKGLAGRRK